MSGNRTMTGYVVGANNRITADGTYNYAYDDENNLTRRTHVASGAYTDYEYDHRNRLSRILEKNSSGTLPKEFRYEYNVFDRRTEKRIDADGAGSQAATGTHFHHVARSRWGRLAIFACAFGEQRERSPNARKRPVERRR